MSPEAGSAAAQARTPPEAGDVLDAARTLRDVVRPTPLERSAELSAVTGGDLRLKLESMNVTGSFKVRGAFNRISRLADGERVVTASSGNHALAVLAACASGGHPATILVGRTVSAAKLALLRRFETEAIQVEVLEVGSDEAEMVARQRASSEGSTYVAPYNDRWVVAGQGTIALEVLAEWPDCDTLVVPIGGGGLISGIGLWAKSIRPSTRVIGVQPAASPTIHEWLNGGTREPLRIGATLADGVAGNLEPDSMTWDLCRELVDEVIVVDEPAIRRAMRWAIEVPRLIVEGSAALPIAAVTGQPERFAGSNAGLVITGRWATNDVIRTILADDPVD